MKILKNTLFYNNYNYGAILQAYALYHKLEELGYECIELNYARGMTKYEWIGRRIWNVVEFVCKHDSFCLKYEEARFRMEQERKYQDIFSEDPIKCIFDKFMKENFQQTGVYNSSTIKGLSENYDVCITGGDQMWNPLWHDLNYYLKFSNKKNIAYSCSVGKDIISEEDSRHILSGLRYINCVSVREKQLYNWLQEKNVEAEFVCDPVFLLSKEEWEEFAVRDENAPEEYIFAYLLGDGKEIRTQIREMANRFGMKLVMIPHVKRRYNPYDVGIADYEVMNVGPKEFVGLIRNAKYVVTDSFHGTAFSIILEKPFISISRFALGDKNALNSRILSVLETYELQERLVPVDNVKDFTEKEFSELDWIKSNKIQKRERENGKLFLKKSLEICLV